MSMFCRQCEQTVGGKGCAVQGACGKDPDTSALQDVLVHALKGIAVYAHRARAFDIRDAEVDRFMIEGLFTTVTNVNFDPKRLSDDIVNSQAIKEKIKSTFLHAYQQKHGAVLTEMLPAAASWEPARTQEGLLRQAQAVGLFAHKETGDDVRSLQELLLYGLKGMAAYADHAALLGEESEEVNAFFHKGLAALADEATDADTLLALVMECGKVNLRCMEVLDHAHTKRLGNPVPTAVSLGVKKGPAIVVSGHDLGDLEALLKQTQGKGINIYTHGEMLPAHAYPELKKHSHLAGHYGSAWQNQQKEFESFPGAILFTTNCIQRPSPSYHDRVFTTGLVAWPGVAHIAGTAKDFSPVINKALQLGGFESDAVAKEITVGFAHKAVLGVADKVIAKVKEGKIRHFFLIGGCDGAKPGRNYYTEFAQKVPEDCVILTLACGKFRFNTLDFGDIDGIPRLLDCGQCNDAYSAITIASALAAAFECSVNDLPLSLILSWYEQKAVVILLSLLSLGIKDIRLGPTLPAFVSSGILNVLVEKFGIKPIVTPDEDLHTILGDVSVAL